MYMRFHTSWKKTRKETGIRGYFILKDNADLEHSAGRIADTLKLHKLLQHQLVANIYVSSLVLAW